MRPPGLSTITGNAGERVGCRSPSELMEYKGSHFDIALYLIQWAWFDKEAQEHMLSLGFGKDRQMLC